MHIDDVALTTNEPSAFAAAYERLGLPVTRQGETVRVRVGTSMVTATRGATAGAHHLAFTIRTGTFDAAIRWLDGRATVLEHDGTREFEGPDGWDSRSVYFDGPDGSILELIERRVLPGVAAGSPFGSEDVVCVSEVGLPADDVPAFTATVDALGIGPYGDGNDGFRPLGDVHGLLIAVRPGRTWFPTADRTAVAQALEVTVSGAGGAGVAEATTLAAVTVR